MKKEIRTDSIWMKIKGSGAKKEYLYGFRDGTNNHGHTVISGQDLIYQRDISGANLVISEAILIFSDNNLILSEALS